MAILSAVVAVSLFSFCRCSVPLCPLVPLSAVPFRATEVHWDWGVIMASQGIRRIELIAGLLVAAAQTVVVIPPILLEGATVVPSVLRHCFKQFLGFDTFYHSFEYCGVGTDKWGGKDIFCYTIGESLEVLLYAGWRSYVVAGFSAEFFEIHHVLVDFWPLHFQILELISGPLILLRVHE